MDVPAFDVTSASEIIISLGDLIVGDSEYRDVQWDAVTLVVTVADSHQHLFGYFYTNDGGWTPGNPGGMALLDQVMALRTATTAPGKRAWKVCRIQLIREEMQLTVDYEYRSWKRWMVTPANLETRVEELRPRPGNDSAAERTRRSWWQRFTH
ncbi:hypothetical protein ACFYTS_19075 [Nocardia sp. NPDC004151]|uniref:hypothetical protein n=1 Tax=Nocardia sp. NPDC004151 TaxID=3364304 RepID=UPI0036B36126